MSDRDSHREIADLPRLPARLPAWQARLCADTTTVHALLSRFGSPVHVHGSAPLLDNAAALRMAAAEAGADLEVFFARKANKALVYVETALDAGLGIDVASAEELRQAAALGARGPRLMVTAAVKPPTLLREAVGAGATVVLDNACEAEALAAVAAGLGRPARVAIRISGFHTARGRLRSRFGFEIGHADAALASVTTSPLNAHLRLIGIHFHLEGYRSEDRVAALDQCLALADRARAFGSRLKFLDMGGGFPVSYAAHGDDWRAFRHLLDQALIGARPPITYRGHGYGRIVHRGEVIGDLETYPHHQPRTAAQWLRAILTAERPGRGETVADALADRALTLYAEPGRFLVDGCGLTVARVVHVKRRPGGERLVGLAMNGSNCRSRKSELLTDPLLVPRPGRRPGPAVAAYATGSYCSEDDLVTHRLLVFDQGIDAGDALVFVNTAGYLMHFTESRSHQFPLPRNAVYEPGRDPRLDRIDRTADLGFEKIPTPCDQLEEARARMGSRRAGHGRRRHRPDAG